MVELIYFVCASWNKIDLGLACVHISKLQVAWYIQLHKDKISYK